MKTLSREGIQRMIDGQGASSGGGGGIQSLAGYATQAWTEENYLSKPYFNQLFTVHTQITTTVVDDQGEPVGEPIVTPGTLAPNAFPGTTETTDEETGYVTTVATVITSIEAKFGFWSQSFISALGQNSSGGGGGATALGDLVDVAITTPIATGSALVYNGTKWVNGLAFDIANPTDGQVLMYNATTHKWYNGTVQGGGGSTAWADITGKPTTLSGYGITDALNSSTKFWGQTVSNGVVNGAMTFTTLAMATNYTDVWNDGTNDHPWYGYDHRYVNTGVYSTTITDYSGLSLHTGYGWICMTQGGNVGIGTPSPAFKLDVNGYAKATRFYLSSGIYFELDSNNHVHLVGAGFYSDSFVSALGLNSSGGGGGSTALTDLTDVEYSGTPSDGQVLKYNGTTHKWYNGTDEGVTSLAWSQITGKPTTLSGYGITDAYTKTEADAKFLTIAFFRSLFKAYTSASAEVVPNSGDTSTIASIKAMFGFWTNQYISALGQGSGGSGGATALNDLTDVEFSGTPSDGQVLMYNATTHKWYNGTVQGGGGSTAWADITGKPTTLAGYGITDAYTKTEADGRYLKLSGGMMDNTNVVTNMNADLLDGLHGADYLSRHNVDNAYDTTPGQKIITVSTGSTIVSEAQYGSLIQWGNSNKTPGTADSNTWYNQLIGMTNDRLYFRTRTNGDDWTTLHKIAYITDNVASATKLQTARTLWGQSFDGTANVSGSISNTGHITSSTHKTYNIGTSTNMYNSIYCKWLGAGANEAFSLGANNNYAIYINTEQNVGIGKSAPAYKLDVNGNTFIGGILYLGQNYGIEAYNSAGLLTYKPASGWTGISNTQWGVGSIDAQGVIRSNNNDLLHYRNGNEYTILTTYHHPSRSYSFTTNTTTITTGKWHRLGNYKTAGNSSNFIIWLWTGSGYNANASQNSFARIVVKDGYQNTASATNSVGITVERFGNFDDTHKIKCVAVATSDTEGALWVYLPWQWSDGTYTISGVYDTWTHNSGYSDDTTTEPTSNQRDTGYFDNIYNLMSPQFTNLRLKPESSNYGSYLYFGEGSNAYIAETTDDNLTYYADKHVFSNGNVGIGTSSPSTKLHVNGNTTLDGNIYQDGLLYSKGNYILLNSAMNTPGLMMEGGITESGTTRASFGLHTASTSHSLSWYNSKVIIQLKQSSTEAYMELPNGVLQIGNIRLIYDSANNALKIQKADGTAANLYVTGGVAALAQT